VLAVAVGELSASRPGRFTPGERASGAHWVGGWVDLRADLDDVEKKKFLTLQGLESRSLGRPARSQSLYRLCYPATCESKYALLSNEPFPFITHITRSPAYHEGGGQFKARQGQRLS
jgi:hypothetical protein